jgi:hypothetical protein
MSFVSPTDILPAKDTFCFDKYIKEVFRPKIDTFVSATKESPASITQFSDALSCDLKEVSNDVTAFLSANRSRLDEEFAALNPMELTTAGFKVRGSYPDMDSARKRAEALQRQDKSMDVFVAQVGAWCPFHPSAESIGDVVYDETELNTLMKLKKEADESRESAYVSSTAERVVATRADGASTSRLALETVFEDAEDAEDAEAEASEETGEAADNSTDQAVDVESEPHAGESKST